MPLEVHYNTVVRQPTKVSDFLISYQSIFRCRSNSMLIIPILILQRSRASDYPWPDHSLVTVFASLTPATAAQSPFQYILHANTFIDAARCHPSEHRSINITEGFPMFTLLGYVKNVVRKKHGDGEVHLFVKPWENLDEAILVTVDSPSTFRVLVSLSKTSDRLVQVTGLLGSPRPGSKESLCIRALSVVCLSEARLWSSIISCQIEPDEWPKLTASGQMDCGVDETEEGTMSSSTEGNIDTTPSVAAAMELAEAPGLVEEGPPAVRHLNTTSPSRSGRRRFF